MSVKPANGGGGHRRPLSQRLFLLCFVVAILLFGGALGGCSGVFFVPQKALVATPGQFGVRYREVEIPMEPGVTLHGWFLPGKPPVKATIVFLHGNAQNISYHQASVLWLPRQHYNVLLYDYRGYGRSGGVSTPQNAIDDFGVVMAEVEKQPEAKGLPVVVLGQSLGASLAIAAVARWKSEYPVAVVVLDSPFSDFRGIVREKLAMVWWLRPLSLFVPVLIPGKPDLRRNIAALSQTPVLLIHGAEDQIIPPEHSRILFRAAKEPRQLWIVPGAKHIAAFGDKAIRERLLAYLDEVLKTPSSVLQIPDTARFPPASPSGSRE